MTAARRKALLFKLCYFLRREYAHVCETTHKGFFRKCACVLSLQSPPGIKIGQGEGGTGVSKCCYSSELQRAPPPFSLSLDVQDVTLFQAKAGLILVKKALQGLDVHFMVQIHHVGRWCFNFWHCDWFPNYKKTNKTRALKQRIKVTVSF